MKTTKSSPSAKPKSNVKGLLILLGISIVLMIMVLKYINSSQDLSSSASKGEGCPKGYTESKNAKGKLVCKRDPKAENSNKKCDNGFLYNNAGEKVCIEKCSKNQQFMMNDNGNFSCVGLKVCKKKQKLNMATNTCVSDCNGNEVEVTEGGDINCKQKCDVTTKNTVWSADGKTFDCVNKEKTCPAGKILNTQNNKCEDKCSGIQRYNEETGTCEINCPSGQIPNIQKTACVNKTTVPANTCTSKQEWAIKNGVGKCVDKPYAWKSSCTKGTSNHECTENGKVGSQICFDPVQSMTDPANYVWSVCNF